MGREAETTTADVPERRNEEPVASTRRLLARRYELQALLGTGGMGTVYRAHDRLLDEIVALKSLRRDLARSPAAIERFRREVKLARKVTHKNVARMFDLGEDRRELFLTMECVDGAPLSSVVQTRRMDVREVVPIALQVCDGLAASHEAGVLHGDLKPANVLHTAAGRIVITDFGIARALTPDPNDPLADEGVVAGTPGYMAPEQVEGDPHLDDRADLYALGCMLFRMLTGTLPWSAATAVAQASARLLRPPPDPRERADVPDAIAAVILKCMARRREDRFASAAEVAEALGGASAERVWVRPPSEPAVVARSIAVLPLVNRSGPEDDYVADGIARELVAVLGEEPSLRVLSQRAAVTGEGAPLAAGMRLGVDAVVHGAVERDGGVVRATLEVLTVADGYTLYAERHEGPRDAIADLAHGAARGIAHVLSAAHGEPTRTRQANAEALDLFFRGSWLYSRQFFRHAEATELLGRAHTLAPDDSRIGAAYALALTRRLQIEDVGPDLAREVREIAMNAVTRDPRSSVAHAALAIVHFQDAEYRSAALELKKALAIDPQQGDALECAGRLLLEVGQTARALETLRAARTIEPEREVLDAIRARAYADLGDFDATDELLATGPHREGALGWRTRARFLLWSRRPDRCAAVLAELERSEHPPEPVRSIVRHQLEVGAGLVPMDPGKVVTASRGRGPRAAAFRGQVQIEVQLLAGDLDGARKALVTLEDEGFLDVAWLDHCPHLDALRESPELRALRRSTGVRAARALATFDGHEGTSG